MYIDFNIIYMYIDNGCELVHHIHPLSPYALMLDDSNITYEVLILYHYIIMLLYYYYFEACNFLCASAGVDYSIER